MLKFKDTMALLYEITRRASSAMTRHIQVCSRMAIMQHDLLCVAYSGTPCWNIRCKSNALSGKGKRKDKAHYARMKSYPSRPCSDKEVPPYPFDLFGGKSKMVNFLDMLGKRIKTNNYELLRILVDNGKPCRTRNKLEMSQHDRRAFSAEGKKSTFQCSNSKNECRDSKRSAKPYEDLLDRAASIKAETAFPKTGGVAQKEFQTIVKDSAKPGHISSGTKEIRNEKSKRSASANDLETNHSLRNTSGKVNLDKIKKDCIQEIKPTFVEIIKNPTKTAADSRLAKNELGFKSGRDVTQGSNFILVDHKLYYSPRSEAQQSGCKSRETESKNKNISKSNTSMLDEAIRSHQSGDPQQQGAVIRGTNFIIVNNKSITIPERDGRGTKDVLTPADINAGPVITNSTDSVANGNKHTFVLVDAVEHNIGKRYGREKRNFVLDNDNPHNIAKSGNAVCNKKDAKQGPRHTVASAKPDGAPRESEKVAKQIKNDGNQKKQIVVENTLGGNNVNTLANEMSKKRSSYMEDNVPLTSFESVIKDSQKLIEQIQKDKHNMSTFSDSLHETPLTATAERNKKLKTNIAKTKSKVVETVVCDNTDTNTLSLDASKLPKVSVKELKPDFKGTKATENDLMTGSRKKKEEGEPSLYVKPEELGKKTSPRLRELGRENELSTQQKKSCNDPSKKIKPDSGKTTSVDVDFENWSRMLRERIMNYQNLSLRHSVGPRADAISEVAVNAPAGSRASTKQTVSPPGISKSPSASSLSAAQEKIHPKTNPKPLDDLRKDIQASFSDEFKSKFSDKTKMNAHDNARSDFITKYSDHVTKDQTTCSNAKLDPVVKSPKLEVKHSATSKLATGDPTTGSGTGVMSKNKEIEGNNTIKLSDRYVLVPASEWAKVRQAIFSREFPQSRGETIKTQDRATPTGDTKDKPSRTAAEPSVCHANMAQKVYKSDDVLAVKQSESSGLATQSSQPTTASSMKRNIVLGNGEKGVSNIFDGTTSSTLGSLVVDKVPSKRYASENEAGRSKSDTSVGPATKPNKIDPHGCGKVVVTKSTSSLPLQPQMRPSASQEGKPQRQGTADEISKLDKAKVTVDSTPTKVKSFDGVAVEPVDPQELQRYFQLQKKLTESYERDLIKFELALKKYKAMLSLAKKSTLKK